MLTWDQGGGMVVLIRGSSPITCHQNSHSSLKVKHIEMWVLVHYSRAMG